nr:HAD family hydrolase [Streptomyces sparsogenes]
MNADALAEVLGASDAVLFDFDGPICDVFRGLPAPGVADELAALLIARVPALEARARATDDPMEIHRLSPEGGGDALKVVETALTEAEVAAVSLAGLPVDGSVQALHAARESGRRVAVVSNNSGECVRRYLFLHGLLEVVDEVIGRPHLRPDLMKPSPHPLLTAASSLDVAPDRTVLVGDSVTDIEAARAAQARSIGFANKPGKRASLTEAGADAVVLDMRSIASALT